ncbi:MAG: metal ABC transporter permease, partial [Planctomycetota bacterium]
VIALLTCPAAAARLFAPTMGRYVLWSAGLGLAAALVGYALSAWAAPATLGHSIDASGAVATTAGLVLAALAVVRGARGARPVALDPKPDR